MSGAIEPRLAEYQLTKSEAIQLAENGTLKALSAKEAALFQFRQDRLCCDFSHFHKGMTELLGRPVYSHEFADPDALWLEYHGAVEKPDFAGIIAKLPLHLQQNMIVLSK